MALLGPDVTKGLMDAQADDFSPIPAGEYIVRAVKADYQPTKDGSGYYVKVEFDIQGPAYQGRKLFARFNLRNSSPKAEQIGRSQFKALYTAGHVPEPVTDTDQILGVVVKATVTVREAEGKYGPSNDIKGYKAVDGTPVGDALPQMPQGGSFSQAFSQPVPPQYPQYPQQPAAPVQQPGPIKW